MGGLKRRHIVLIAGLLLLIPLLLVLVRIWAVQSLFDDMAQREYTVYSFEVPNSALVLEAREWQAFRASGVEFYLSGGETDAQLLDSVGTNEYLPFAHGDYRLEWGADTVTVFYGYTSAGRKEITLFLSTLAAADPN